MLRYSAILRFAFLVLAAYAALTMFWMIPSIQDGYGRFFRSFGDAAFSQFWFWPDARVRFLDAGSTTLTADINAVLPGKLPEGFKPPGERGEKDTLMIFLNKNVPSKPGFFRTASRLIGFAPTAVLIALCVATPVPWRRRVGVLVVGLVFVHLFILLRMTILSLKNGFADASKGFALFNPGPWMNDLLRRLDIILTDNPTFAYLASVFLWLMTLFFIEQWFALRKKPSLLSGDAPSEP